MKAPEGYTPHTIYTKYAPVERTWRAYVTIKGKYYRAYANSSLLAVAFLVRQIGGIVVRGE